jgi:Carboxypeptidase regulatory-like domain/TonB-dependent Receptor Plug Domain
MRFAAARFGIPLFVAAILAAVVVPAAWAQAAGSATVKVTVQDPTGSVVANADVTIRNPVSGFERSAETDTSGSFTFTNVPFNPYHMTVIAAGFAPFVEDIDLRSAVPQSISVSLTLAAATTNVTVTGEPSDLLENEPTAHTDVDRTLFEKVPLESASSSLSSLVTLASPGIAADSNGLFHGMGDHAENSFSVDGQPITDQQSKVFSNQIPMDAIQSLTVIAGAPPAEYGDKTSVVIDVTTRSGQGVTTPHGSITADYGSFGSVNGGFDLSYGGQKWGNFISANGLNGSRFLDPPEFAVIHDKGNEENIFDRVDYQLSSADSVHLNMQFTRSWFQTPNSFDAQNATMWFGEGVPGMGGVGVSNGGFAPSVAQGCTSSVFCGKPVGPTDQHSQIRTYNIAPSWTHLIGSNALFTLGAFVRHDEYNYDPSADPFSDLGPPSLQRESVAQYRTLTNAGAHAEFSYVKDIHNVKAGITYEQTFLTEDDSLGIVDPTFNAPCLSTGPNETPVIGPAGVTNPSECAAHGFAPNDLANLNAPANPSNPNFNLGFANQYPLFNSVLFPFDLTRGGTLFRTASMFPLHTDVKELGLYLEDAITKGNWNFNLGMRGDIYNGITAASQAEPRVGVAYNIKPSSTVLRISYARTLETPFNENLVLSSIGCGSPVLNLLLSCSSTALTAVQPGFRNEFHAGFQQAFGRYMVVDAEYIWKYTHNAYDFSVLGNTPITFPIQWRSSKIPGFAIRASVPNFHGVTAFVVMSSVAARFFLPQVAGAGAIPSAPSGVFRIDHDERYNETTHLQYQPWKAGPWIGFNWRYDSGLVAGATPCFGVLATNSCPGSIVIAGVPNVSMVASNVGSIPLSADQEFEAGFTCNGVRATPTTALPFNCPASQFSSTLIKVPLPNTENDDHNPPRIQQRNLFDLAIGDDNLFHADRYKWSVRVTLINLTNNYVLYNFLSTFSGTHYVTPRTVTGEVGFHF